MKKFEFCLVLVSCILVIGLTGCGKQSYSDKVGNWIVKTIDHFNLTTASSIKTTAVSTLEYGGAYPSLTFTSTGEPRIAYSKMNFGEDNTQVKYTYPTNTSWETWNYDTIIDTGFACGFPSLALDSNNLPHVIYATNTGGLGKPLTEGYRIRYAHYTGVTWETQTIYTSDNGICRRPSLKLGSDGIPRISFTEYPSGSESTGNGWINYAIWTGSTWEITKVATRGDFSSIALDNQNRPHIALIDGNVSNTANYSIAVKYAHYNGTTWEVETITSIDNASSWPSISLALDSSGNPSITYTYGNYAGTEKFVKYSYKSGSSWTAEDVYSDKYVDNASIALNNSGTPYIVHCDSPGGGVSYLRYSVKDSSGWILERIEEGNSTACFSTPSIAFYNNKPYVAYYDRGAGTIGYLKFATQ